MNHVRFFIKPGHKQQPEQHARLSQHTQELMKDVSLTIVKEVGASIGRKGEVNCFAIEASHCMHTLQVTQDQLTYPHSQRSSEQLSRLSWNQLLESFALVGVRD